MAAALSLSLTSDLHHHQHHRIKSHRPFLFRPSLSLPHKSDRYTVRSSSTPSHSSPTAPTTSYDSDPLKANNFLTNEDLEKLKLLGNFEYVQELESGSMWVRVMRADEMDSTVALLAESFAESMLLPYGYVSLLKFLVKQYLIERRGLMPHTATLIGFYKEKDQEDEEGEEQLAGTVEVCFNKMGANASPPTPLAPMNSPYICNMAVRKPLRRRGIGWHLLKAGEELISQMSSSREVYLHCRMIDSAPFNMYIKAGYDVVETDSILMLLMLQRRKHLMCKKLPESYVSCSDVE